MLHSDTDHEGATGVVDVWAGLGARLDVLRARPELGSWVEVRRFALSGGNTQVIAGNRRDLVYYELSAAEGDVLALLDGTRSVGEVVVAHLQGSGELDTAAIVNLVRSLHEGNFLVDRYVDADAALRQALHPDRGARAGFERFLRTLSIEWRGAERLIRWLYFHGVRYLFMPFGVLVALVVAAGGFAAFLAVSDAEGFHVTTQSVGVGFAILLVLDLVVVFVHELGHAALLVHYRGRVKSAGFRIYFGSPAFFVESSDALLLDRRRRIAQSAAGVYLEAVLTGIAALVLFVIPDGWVAQLLFRLCIINYFVILLNLVPLLELDGYWILSDAIRVPDLRPRSLAFWRRDVWRKAAGRDRWAWTDVGLGLYATAGVVFTIFCFVSAYFFWERTFGDAIHEMWAAGPVGIVLLAVLVLFIGGPLIRGLVQALLAVGRRLQGWWHAIRFRSQRRWRIEAATLLDAQPGFADLPVEVLNDVAGRVRRRGIANGETVIHQGDHADAYYVVRHGTLDVFMEDPDTGRTELRRRVLAGESFGEFGLVTGAPRTATVRATSRCDLFVIDKGTFERLLADRMVVPEFAPTLQQLAELRALPPFAHLGAAELQELTAAGAWVHFEPGHVVMTQGARGEDFYALESGRVEIIRDGVRTHERGPGEHVGELALLLDQPRIATVRAITPVRAFRLDRDGFNRLVRDGFRRGTVRPNLRIERMWDT